MRSFTIKEFCERQSIGRTFYYALEKQGKGPRTFTIGTRVGGSGRLEIARADGGAFTSTVTRTATWIASLDGFSNVA